MSLAATLPVMSSSIVTVPVALTAVAGRDSARSVDGSTTVAERMQRETSKADSAAVAFGIPKTPQKLHRFGAG